MIDMIKAICFDLDGVYFTPESFKKFKKNLPKKVNDPDKADYVLHDSEELLNFKNGKITEKDYWDFARSKLGIKVSNEEIFAILRDSYEVNSDVKNYVKKVRSAGYKTCICSNNFETRVRELDKKFSFIQEFDVVVFSYQVGVMKPDVKIFQELVKKIRVNPEEIIYSDDNEDKLEGAKSLGIKTFVYEDFKSFQRRLEELGANLS
jgi:epoxide hydrolase-like predicted phosphatase